MKVYLWGHIEGIFLVNGDLSMIAKPYFVTHPKRISLLKDKILPGMDNNALLSTITNEELKELVNKSVIKWKPMIQFRTVYSKEKQYGFVEEYIASADI